MELKVLVVMMNKISEMLVMIVVVEISSVVHLEYKHSYHLMNNSLDPYKHVGPSEWDEIL